MAYYEILGNLNISNIISLSEREVRETVSTISVPGLPLDPIGHAGVLPAPITVDGVNSDIGIYTYATFMAGAGTKNTNLIIFLLLIILFLIFTFYIN